MSDYLETTQEFYKRAAIEPQEGLCCTTNPVWELPGLSVPRKMQQMNYGCGTTVHSRDLANAPTVLYVGAGAGMELLQFAYLTQRKGSVIGLEPVDEMLEACEANLKEAEKENDWFDRSFVDLRKGDAFDLSSVADESVEVAAQNCLFNIFRPEDLKKALSEVYRVLAPHGRLVMSDPICETELPHSLRENEELRAACLSGSLPMKDYIGLLTDAGFGTIEVRAKRPYRVLDPRHYEELDQKVVIESLEVAAIKDPIPSDGPCVFTGRTAIYHGDEDHFDDGKGHTLLYNQPLAVCDKTAAAFEAMDRTDITVTPSTYFYDGGGCC